MSAIHIINDYKSPTHQPYIIRKVGVPTTRNITGQPYIIREVGFPTTRNITGQPYIIRGVSDSSQGD